MRAIYNPQEIYSQITFAKREGRTIGLVPTMGALHAGHLSLVEAAAQVCDMTAATIFVNPSQFGPNEDFAQYPRTLDEDLTRLQSVGTDFVFVPTQDHVYPSGFSTYIEPPAIARRLEGEFRPEHFRGVATVVLKLFNMVPATVAFFGQKDYQQVQVIRHMVEDLNLPMRVETCPTIREHDGLAMSSRNRFLSPEERVRALGLWRALQLASEMVSQGKRRVAEIEYAMKRTLEDSGVSGIDYARVVHADDLTSSEQLESPSVALIAARVGKTRLIDNLPLEID